jgi:uncharacterized membrane-anchored protein YhcB (DUF1043 family)
MSDEQFDAIIAQLVRERSAARRQRAAIESQLARAAEVLESLAHSLRYITNHQAGVQAPLELLREQAQFLDPSPLANLIREHAALKEKIARLDREARELGID